VSRNFQVEYRTVLIVPGAYRADKMKQTDDLRIIGTKELVSPAQIREQYPISEQAAETTMYGRQAIIRLLGDADDRLLVVAGPCSIHDPRAALEYAERLADQRRRYQDDLEIIMRIYFEKPRTTVGWKGLINDPDLDESFNINKGIGVARKLLLDINEMGVPAGTEYLDLITPQYIADLVAWGAIGARTTESQCHRELASGLSCPVGFKNGTNGNLKIAIDAIGAAINPHSFLSVTKEGRTAIFSSNGNSDCHIILRGGLEPNFDAVHVQQAAEQLAAAVLPTNVMIDFSHANSLKQPQNQLRVCHDVSGQIAGGDDRIFGVMIESNLVAGRQEISAGKDLVYGQSITDGCIAIEDTEVMFGELADAVRRRRAA
jgi:3-deoxy-7-phosphoheptulonate synthase